MGSIPAALDITKVKKSNFFKKFKQNTKPQPNTKASFLTPNSKASARRKAAIARNYLKKFRDVKVKGYPTPFIYNRLYNRVITPLKRFKAARYYHSRATRYISSRQTFPKILRMRKSALQKPMRKMPYLKGNNMNKGSVWFTFTKINDRVKQKIEQLPSL